MRICLLLLLLTTSLWQRITAYSNDLFAQQRITYRIEAEMTFALREHEKISFVNTGVDEATLDPCCDSFKVFVNGKLVINLASSQAGPGETWWEYKAIRDRTEIRVAYIRGVGSDPGLKGTYYITCEKPCNFGTCEVNRYYGAHYYDNEPLLCKCFENYGGKDCNVTTAPKATEGVLIPYTSGEGTSSRWDFQLHPNELITFGLHDIKTSGALVLVLVNNETSLLVNNKTSFPTKEEIRLMKDNFTVISGVSGGNVSVSLQFPQYSYSSYQLQSEDVRTGNPRISYNISCTPGYCKGGDCHTNRTNTTSNPPFCKCHAHYKGPRCEQTVHDCPLDCSENSECVWTGERYTCKCLIQGFVHNGTECIDINECESPENPCSSTEICVNTPGSYECKCPPDHQALQTSAGIDCVFSGCAFPWNESKDRKCYLTEGSRKTAKNASDYCGTFGAALVKTENMSQVEEIGLASKSALVWISLTDSEGEEDNWKWDNTAQSSSPNFSNWGPGFPDGSADFAVLYPNRWTTKFRNCNAKKRFICETTDPFCPSEWIRLENVPGKCFFQSKTVCSHKEAVKKCSQAAAYGKLAVWNNETFLNFKPTFWDSVIGEGSAQFWVKHTICGGISNCTMLFETAFDPFLVAKEIFDNLGSIFRNKTQDQTEDIFQDKSCAYIFPNKWADYNHDKSMFRNSPGPAVACQRRTSYKLLKNLDKVGTHFEPSGFPRTTEMAMTNVVNSIKPPEKVSTSMYTNVEQTTESIQTEVVSELG
ncbi:unnamed protein product [Notodromas monacha]|uniref:Uncharacterized protein n=1 Tax=Notodromas monacha TaxID=399045 RepID=A0A7R9GEI7_9CRUS|nr:unnamed protein product [Notodromas monacha]CAG0919779.1 unnamed protein product [Notodromas monacha]